MLPGQAITLICVSAILSFLASVAVGLRLRARRLSRNSLNWSDYFICFTLLCAILNAITCIIGGAACGLGSPLPDLPDYMQVRFLKILFATQFFYIFSVWSVKVSVLLFYKSLFPTPGFKRAVNLILVFLGAWIIAFFFVTLFQDKPIQRNWGTVGATINWRIFYLVETGSDLVLDVLILCMPLPVIARLHVSTRKKWFLANIFGVGVVIVVASSARFAYMYQVMLEFETENDDFSYTTVNYVVWGAIEPCASVIAACLPILTPAILQKRAQTSNPAAISTFFQNSRSIHGTPQGRRGKGNDSMEEEFGRAYLDTQYSTHESHTVEQGGITITSRVEITHELR